MKVKNGQWTFVQELPGRKQPAHRRKPIAVRDAATLRPADSAAEADGSVAGPDHLGYGLWLDQGWFRLRLWHPEEEAQLAHLLSRPAPLLFNRERCGPSHFLHYTETMNTPVVKKLMLWKTAESGLVAHLYEHIITQQVEEWLQSRGYLAVVDYSLWGTTYGTTCYLELLCWSSQVERQFTDAVGALRDTPPTPERLQVAAAECACEYIRPLTRLDEDALMREIEKLHVISWRPIRDFSIEQAQQETSVNTVFELPFIRYGRRNLRSFSPTIIEYTLPSDLQEESPGHKVLAAIVLQAVALNFNAYLKREHTYYDAGDRWPDEGGSVSYKTALVFPKRQAPSWDVLRTDFGMFMREMHKCGLVDKLVATICDVYAADPIAAYFDQATLVDITRGIVIGGAGWQALGDRAVVGRLVDEVHIELHEPYQWP